MLLIPFMSGSYLPFFRLLFGLQRTRRITPLVASSATSYAQTRSAWSMSPASFWRISPASTLVMSPLLFTSPLSSFRSESTSSAPTSSRRPWTGCG